MSRNRKVIATNKNARISSRLDRTGKLRTETTRRDNGELDVAISTNPRTGRTRVFVDADGRNNRIPFASLELNGHQARTLFIALEKHFRAVGTPSPY